MESKCKVSLEILDLVFFTKCNRWCCGQFHKGSNKKWILKIGNLSTKCMEYVFSKLFFEIHVTSAGKRCKYRFNEKKKQFSVERYCKISIRH